jgi:hypothetical protein
MAARKYSKLTDRDVETLVGPSMVGGALEWGEEGRPITLHDVIVPGLRIRIGKHRRTWIYFQEYSIKGKRGTVYRTLGFWPRMNAADARKEALQHAARVAAGKPQPGKRTAITLEAATADYIESLKARGKKSARFVASLMRIHLLPDFGRFTLAELSDAPALLRDHHLKISKAKPVAANRVMSILSAIYHHASRLDALCRPRRRSVRCASIERSRNKAQCRLIASPNGGVLSRRCRRSGKVITGFCCSPECVANRRGG